MLNVVGNQQCLRFRGVVLARVLSDCCGPWAKLIDNAEVVIARQHTRVKTSNRHLYRNCPTNYLQAAQITIASPALTELNFALLLGTVSASTPRMIPQQEFWPSVEGVVVLGAGAFQGTVELWDSEEEEWVETTNYVLIPGGIQLTDDCTTQRVRVTGMLREGYCVDGTAALPLLELRVLCEECSGCSAGVLAVSRFELVRVSELNLITQTMQGAALTGLARGRPAFIFERANTQTQCSDDIIEPPPPPPPPEGIYLAFDDEDGATTFDDTGPFNQDFVSSGGADTNGFHRLIVPAGMSSCARAKPIDIGAASTEFGGLFTWRLKRTCSAWAANLVIMGRLDAGIGDAYSLSSDTEHILYMPNGAQVQYYQACRGSGPPALTYNFTVPDINDGVEHDIEFTRDGSGVIRLFIDGVLNASSYPLIGSGFNYTLKSATKPFCIGGVLGVVSVAAQYRDAQILNGTCLHTTSFTPPA